MIRVVMWNYEWIAVKEFTDNMLLIINFEKKIALLPIICFVDINV